MKQMYWGRAADFLYGAIVLELPIFYMERLYWVTNLSVGSKCIILSVDVLGHHIFLL